MNYKLLVGFVAGVVVCTALLSTNAFAKPQNGKPGRQVTVQLEWITTSGAKRTVDTLALVADVGRQSTSRDVSTAQGVQSTESATITATVNGDKSITLDLNCHITRAGSEISEADCSTSLTVRNEETKVVKMISRKTDAEKSDTVLLVTPRLNE